MADGTLSQGASTTETTTAVMRTQVLGKILSALASSNAAVVTAIEAVTSAITASIVGGSTGATDNAILRAKGTTGRALDAGPLTLADGGNISGFPDGTGFLDDAGNEQLLFGKTASAITYWKATNQATGTPPTFQALGETNTKGQLLGNGTGNVEIKGTGTNDNATTGFVGQLIESTILVASAVALATNTTEDVTTISLTAGDWDVWGSVWFSPAATTSVTMFAGAVSTTSDTLPTAPGSGAFFTFIQAATVPAAIFGLPAGTRRISLSATTTVYLVTRATFTVDTLAAYGYIAARRIR